MKEWHRLEGVWGTTMDKLLDPHEPLFLLQNGDYLPHFIGLLLRKNSHYVNHFSNTALVTYSALDTCQLLSLLYSFHRKILSYQRFCIRHGESQPAKNFKMSLQQGKGNLIIVESLAFMRHWWMHLYIKILSESKVGSFNPTL